MTTTAFSADDTFFVGCHLSSGKGFTAMGRTALKIGANSFQFFTRNPRGGQAKALDEEDIRTFLQLASEHHFGPLLAHAPYTLNGCSAEPKIKDFALRTMQDDLARMEHLPGNLYNFHPGSHVGQGTAAGIRLIARMMNEVMTADMKTTVLLETMAGKGSEIGGKFEEIRQILDRLDHPEKAGVCLDTCHVHDSGYPIDNNLEEILNQFDRIIGLERLKAIHLNDSLNPLASHKDRHAALGAGTLNKDFFSQIINHPACRKLPFLLETPNDLNGYAEEIAMLKTLRTGRMTIRSADI